MRLAELRLANWLAETAQLRQSRRGLSLPHLAGWLPGRPPGARPSDPQATARGDASFLTSADRESVLLEQRPRVKDALGRTEYAVASPRCDCPDDLERLKKKLSSMGFLEGWGNNAARILETKKERVIVTLLLALGVPCSAQLGVILGMLGVLSWKAFPAIAKGLETRQSNIQAAIDSARSDRDEARRLLDEHQRQLDQARREAKGILQEGREAGERLREEILAETRKENEAMLERARRELAREKDDLLESVRREAVDLSLAAAERLVRETLDDDANRRLVREYIAEMD